MMKSAMAGAVAISMALTGSADTASESVDQTALPTPFQPYEGAVIDFEVLRKGKPFGRHVLTFKDVTETGFKVTTDVDLTVKFGPITAFKYRLDATETWADGQLVALSGKSNSDGDKGRVEAINTGGELVVDSTLFNGALPLSTIPSSHWNILQVKGDQMLSTETGEVLDIDVETIGMDTVMVGGEAIEATHYRLKSDLVVDLWYDDQNRWVKLIFEARGQEIEYVLSEMY
ncbi:MAG: DUF6134 family protein [Pseudomonadota bacterium]